MLSFVMFVAAAAAPAQPTPAQAAPVSIADPRTMVPFLQSQGYQAVLDLTGKTPTIKTGVSGWKYSMIFHGCEGGKDCGDLLLYVGWTSDDDKTPTLEKINDFNREHRFARAYIDSEKDPVLEMDIVFTDHQMSEAMLKEHLEIWSAMVAKFAKHIEME